MRNLLVAGVGTAVQPPVQQPADNAPAEGTANELTQDQLACPDAWIGLALRSPPRFRLLQAVEPLVELSQTRVWWKLRDLVSFVLSHASPLCVAPAETHGARQGTRNMAESDTAKARTLYEADFR